MNTHVDKSTESKSNAIANSSTIPQSVAELPVQFEDNRPISVTQRKIQQAANTKGKPSQALQRKENKTGLPDQLKSGVEALSGHSMDDVKVHYNSSAPAQMQAHAFAQGTDIHLGAGQEKHLPHEAWHVAQQKQGRVKPTMQMKGKVNINDDRGLEKEADVMGAKAMQMKYIGGETIKPNTSKVDSSVVQQIQIRRDNGVYYPVTHGTGDIVESDTLAKQERKKVADNLSGNAGVLSEVQKGWRNMTHISTLFVTEEKRITAVQLYKASQDTSGSLAQLLAAQKDWQDYLADNKVSMSKVLSVHRSFGLEYEFATWDMVDSDSDEEVESHTTVGKSGVFSKLFGVPFVLETDAQNELELVGPPLLAGSGDGKVNKAFIKAAHTLFVNYLVQLRTSEIEKENPLDQLPLATNGVGDEWSWETEAGKIKIAAERTKWSGTVNEIAHQLNIVLTPDEIAAEIKKEKDTALTDDHGKFYKKIRQKFLTAKTYTDLDKPSKAAINSAILILSKGISNSIAVPTLQLVAARHKAWGKGDLHSHVKDLHGLWIKDNVPNITLAAVEGNYNAKQNLKKLIQVLSDDIVRAVLTGVPDFNSGKGDERNYLEDDKFKPAKLKKDAEAEAKACLDEIVRRLGEYDDKPSKNTKTEFLQEEFGSGYGVRKDTYANVGRSEKSSLHLTEFRSNSRTDKYLG